MPKLEAGKRARLPDSAFAYVDSKGNRRLPINDAAHVKNALARFNQVAFESEVSREKARKRLLNAAKKYGIVPVGFITGQLQSERDFGADHARKAEAEALPTGTVALMMTDIEGSTNLVHDLGDAYGELLDDIRGLVRGTLSSRRGHEVDVRADEVFAVFEDAVGAVEAAMGIQRALKVKSWPGGVEVRIRIGVHHGRPTRRGNGYIGIAVHTTARLCAFARGGQIVTSAEVRDAVRGSGIKFRSLGVISLPGLPEPQPLYQVQINLA
jgi:class 3 adenylate cyclase